MSFAVNPNTGEALFHDGTEWKPAPKARNPDTGEELVHDGKVWRSAPTAKITVRPQAPAQTYVSPPSDAEMRATPAPTVPDAVPYPISDIPGVGLQPDPSQPGPEWGRQGKLAAQAVGSGLVGAATFPLDAATLLSRLGQWGVDKVMTAAGARPIEDYGPRIPLLSETITDASRNVAERFGYEPVKPEGFKEQLASNVIELGSQGPLLGAALVKGAGKRAIELAKPGALPIKADPLLAPYAAAPLKTILGDTVAGAGAGTALTGTQQIPDDWRAKGGGSVGFVSDLVAMLLGGHTGGALASATTGLPTRTGQLVTRNKPALDIPVDPLTGAPVTRQTADDASAFIQSATTRDPRATAQEIETTVDLFRRLGLPVPTTGLLTEDIGLMGLEKRQRTKAGGGTTQMDPHAPPEVRQQYSFGERDQALRDSAAENVASIRPPDAVPSVFPQRAQTVADMRVEQAQRELDRAVGRGRSVDTAMEGPANELSANVGQAPGASRNIFDQYSATRTAERERAQSLYDSPDWQRSNVDVNPLLEAAQDVHARATPAVPIHPEVEGYLARIETARDTGTLTGRELNELTADIEGAIKKSLKNSSLFKQLKDLKNGITNTIQDIPTDHPGRQAVVAARENYQERIFPNFRGAVGGNLDLRLKTNPGQVYPETAGGEFLTRGTDAQQLMRIAQMGERTEEVAAQARTWLFDKLARTNVIKDGAIDPDRLTRWRNVNAEVINAIPEMTGEINTMIRDARRGVGLSEQYAAEARTAEANLKNVQKDIASGPLGMVAGKDPQRAIGAIFASDNPVANMRALRQQVGNNPESLKSLHGALADYFLAKVQNVDAVTGEPGVKFATLVKEFEKNRAAMAEVFNPEQMQALQRAQTVLAPLLKRDVKATTGSVTAEATEAALRPLELALKGYYGILKGGGVFRTVRLGLKTLAGDTAMPVEQLVTRAMFDPDLAQALLTRDVKRAGTPAWNGELQKALRRVTAGREAISEDE